MFTIIGFFIIFGSILGGFLMHGGNVVVLYQLSEFTILGGSAIGLIIIMASNWNSVRKLVQDLRKTIKQDPYTKEEYLRLLSMMYELFRVGKMENPREFERHLETPEASEIFKENSFFLKNTSAVTFLTDTLKVYIGGTIPTRDLIKTLEIDVDQYYKVAMRSARNLREVGDAMPGFGIVAAVLGVIITMGLMDKGAEQIGHGIASALVGTFLGVLSAYGIFHPLAKTVANHANAEIAYIECLRSGITAYMGGANPITCVEFARRSIEPDKRPSFEELENATRRKGSNGEQKTA